MFARIPLVAGALLIGLVGRSYAQETTDSSAQGYAPASPAPAATPAPAAAPPAPAARANTRAAIGAELGFIDVLPNRPASRIRTDQDAARADLREADIALADANQLKEQTKAMVEVKKQEISTIDARRKLAQKSKQEAEVVTLEAEKKDAERHKTFLERRVSLHEAEVDRAKAAKRLAEANERALELETQLVNRREDRAAGGDPVAARRQEAVILELERKVLEARRGAAEAHKQLADKEVDIARRQLELHKAQVAAAGE